MKYIYEQRNIYASLYLYDNNKRLGKTDPALRKNKNIFTILKNIKRKITIKEKKHGFYAKL